MRAPPVVYGPERTPEDTTCCMTDPLPPAARACVVAALTEGLGGLDRINILGRVRWNCEPPGTLPNEAVRSVIHEALSELIERDDFTPATRAALEAIVGPDPRDAEIARIEKAHDDRVTELLEANNMELDRRRLAEQLARHLEQRNIQLGKFYGAEIARLTAERDGMRAALGLCQRTLADLIGDDETLSIVSLYDQCVAAELAARKALQPKEARDG